MEALFILLGDLIILPVALLLPVIIEGAVAALLGVSFLLETLFGFSLGLASRIRKRTPDEQAEQKHRFLRRLKWIKRAAITFAILLSVSFLTVCLLNYVFFESTIRWGLARIEKRSGINITFTSAKGNLLSGELTLTGVTANRKGNALSDFVLQAQEFHLKTSLRELFARSTRLESVSVKGLSGEFHRIVTADRIRIRKRYSVDHFQLEDLNVSIRDLSHTNELDFRLKIEKLDAAPLRSGVAWFDLLFRANAKGEIADAPFSIETQSNGSGRVTKWSATGLPASLVGRPIGGPFAWISGGTVDIRVEDRWKLADSAEVEMDWQFVFKDLQLASPDKTSLSRRVIAVAISDYLRKHADDLDIHFTLRMNENQFDGAASVAAAGLWAAARTGLAEELAKRTGTDPQKWEDGMQKGIDLLKEQLDQRRKKNQ